MPFVRPKSIVRSFWLATSVTTEGFGLLSLAVVLPGALEIAGPKPAGGVISTRYVPPAQTLVLENEYFPSGPVVAVASVAPSNALSVTGTPAAGDSPASWIPLLLASYQT